MRVWAGDVVQRPKIGRGIFLASFLAHTVWIWMYIHLHNSTHTHINCHKLEKSCDKLWHGCLTVRAEIAKIYWISVWLPSCHVKQTYQAQPYLLRFVLEGKLHACSWNVPEYPEYPGNLSITSFWSWPVRPLNHLLAWSRRTVLSTLRCSKPASTCRVWTKALPKTDSDRKRRVIWGPWDQ